MDKLKLMKTANEVRKGIVTSVHSAKAGHPGGSLSAADLFTYLYFEELNVDPKDPKKADRDRFVLSKGHTAPGLYAALAEKGFFPKEDLITLRHTGSYLQGHPDMKCIPGVDMSSGSLGQGVSAAVGMAIAAKISGDDYRVYTLLGDGEIQEGQVWEAAMLASHHKLFAFCFHEIARLIIFIYYGLVTGTSVCLVLRKFFFDFTQQKIIVIRFRHILIVFIDNNLPPSTSTLCSCSYLPHKYANNPLAHLYLQKNTC